MAVKPPYLAFISTVPDEPLTVSPVSEANLKVPVAPSKIIEICVPTLDVLAAKVVTKAVSWTNKTLPHWSVVARTSFHCHSTSVLGGTKGKSVSSPPTS